MSGIDSNLPKIDYPGIADKTFVCRADKTAIKPEIPNVIGDITLFSKISQPTSTSAITEMKIMDIGKVEPPASLPEHVDFRTNKDTFTEKQYFSVRDGKIWTKPNPDTGEKGEWELLNGTGLPGNPEKKKFLLPGNIVEISAETAAGHLIAVSDKGTVFDMFEGKWKDTWGLPPTKGIKMPDNKGWAIARRDANSTYTDIAGHPHKSTVGVTTLYVLSPDGKTINFGDAWLPDFNNPIYGPERGTFAAKTFAAAGSTMFVMNEYGDMYTKLGDFDTEGQDPLLENTYTYDPNSKASTRVLPGEDWLKQPKIDGKITGQITVVQTGPDSHDREIRVEGVDRNGKGGYYSKEIYKSDKWTFVPTGAKMSGPFIDNRPKDSVSLTKGPSRDIDLKEGTIKTKWLTGSQTIKAELNQFNPKCSPSILHFELDGKSYDCKLHLRTLYFKSLVIATLELPDALLKAKGPEASKFVKDGLDGKKYVELKLDQEDNKIQVHNLLHTINMEFKKP